MKKFLSSLFLTAISLAIAASVLPPISNAQVLTNTKDLQSMTQTVGNTAGFTDMEVGDLVSGVISVVLGLLGVVFLALTVVAGFQWMTASGNEEQVKKAQSSMKNAIIGLVIVLAAYTITYFLFKALPFVGGSGMPAAG